MGSANLSSRVILALDVDTIDQARDLVSHLAPSFRIFKVGYQLFTHYGIQALEMVKGLGGEVFLDLKFHDIPETVARACEEATRHRVKLFTIHALGGKEMIKRAAEQTKMAAEKFGVTKPLVLAVTVLTSLNQEQIREVGIDLPLKDSIIRLAQLAQEGGADGVIASAQEAALIKENCGKSFLVIAPGIRPAFASAHDQKRIATPRAAFEAGADYIVIGRPITQAKDPVEAAKKLIEELREL
ncbi:MAG: orotidine-5'-phosphate decarboxylase [Proteobacteria bacterium]|nr:orotidine-5'-phosphate decarboxylase [Pseudomonadota bacterium]